MYQSCLLLYLLFIIAIFTLYMIYSLLLIYILCSAQTLLSSSEEIDKRTRDGDLSDVNRKFLGPLFCWSAGMVFYLHIL